MKPSSLPANMRDALRIFRITIAVKLVFAILGLPASIGLYGKPGIGILVRGAPLLILAAMVLIPWVEHVLGRALLAVVLALDVFTHSLQSAPLFFSNPEFWLDRLAISREIVESLVQALPTEPFFFLLIPLLLFAWGYGRRGALWGSTWAAVLHLGIGIWAMEMNFLARPFFVVAAARIALLYLVPLIVSVLAERERRQHAELSQAHHRLQRHATTVEQLAISRERNRLARDLHDTLAHSLSAITVQLEALRTLMTNDPQSAQELVQDISALARRGLEESRQAIQALRSDPVETLGLAGAIREQLRTLRARAGIHAELGVAGNPQDLTAAENEGLYRIAEEALSNIERHASAKQVKVQLAFGVDRTDLVIQDDGTGFDSSTVGPDSFGLTGMRERAEILGATLDVNTAPGQGTEVWCSLPR